MAENVAPAVINSIEEAPLTSLKSTFDVSEHAPDPATEAANAASAAKPLAVRLTDAKPVARKGAYEELAKLFGGGDADAAAAFEEHAPALKKVLLDNASLCHEAALSAAIAFAAGAPDGVVEERAASLAGAVVDKLLPTPKLVPKALEALLTFVRRGAGAAVLGALLSGAASKVPKVCGGAAKGLSAVLKEHGAETPSLKQVIGVIACLINHRDKGVRDEAQTVFIEVHRIKATRKDLWAALTAGKVPKDKVEALEAAVAGVSAAPKAGSAASAVGATDRRSAGRLRTCINIVLELCKY